MSQEVNMRQRGYIDGKNCAEKEFNEKAPGSEIARMIGKRPGDVQGLNEEYLEGLERGYVERWRELRASTHDDE